MEMTIDFEVCDCRRHGHYILIDTGERVSAEFICQQSAIIVLNSLHEDALITEWTYDDLMGKISQSGLPVETPNYVGTKATPVMIVPSDTLSDQGFDEEMFLSIDEVDFVGRIHAALDDWSGRQHLLN